MEDIDRDKVLTLTIALPLSLGESGEVDVHELAAS